MQLNSSANIEKGVIDIAKMDNTAVSVLRKYPNICHSGPLVKERMASRGNIIHWGNAALSLCVSTLYVIIILHSYSTCWTSKHTQGCFFANREKNEKCKQRFIFCLTEKPFPFENNDKILPKLSIPFKLHCFCFSQDSVLTLVYQLRYREPLHTLLGKLLIHT